MLLRRWKRTLAAALATLIVAAATIWFTPGLFVPVLTRLARIAMRIQAAEVDVQGRVWGYLEAGPASAPPVLLLHGFGTSREAMMSLMSWLREDHRCLAPDLPGFGQHPYHQGRTHDADFYASEVV